MRPVYLNALAHTPWDVFLTAHRSARYWRPNIDWRRSATLARGSLRKAVRARRVARRSRRRDHCRKPLDGSPPHPSRMNPIIFCHSRLLVTVSELHRPDSRLVMSQAIYLIQCSDWVALEPRLSVCPVKTSARGFWSGFC